MWGRLKIWLLAVAEEVRPSVDWDNPNGREPDWPTDKKPKTHVCDGCDTDRSVDTFEVVDRILAGIYSPLVRCAECRAIQPTTRGAYDDREVKA